MAIFVPEGALRIRHIIDFSSDSGLCILLCCHLKSTSHLRGKLDLEQYRALLCNFSTKASGSGKATSMIHGRLGYSLSRSELMELSLSTKESCSLSGLSNPAASSLSTPISFDGLLEVLASSPCLYVYLYGTGQFRHRHDHLQAA